MKISLLIIIIVAEVITIIFVGINIYYKHTANFTASISPLSREGLVFNHESELEYFYEPGPADESSYIPPWLPYKPKFTINSDTLNDRFEYSIDKPEDTFRIISLGDSWAYGQFVHTENNFSEVLEDLLNDELECGVYKKFEVINLGVPSYDIKYSVERFKRRGAKYDPDLVIWLLIENDFSEINEFIMPRSDFYIKQMQANGELSINKEEFSNAWTQFEKPAQAWLMAIQDQYKELGGEENISKYQETALHSIYDYYKNTLMIFTLPYGSKIGENNNATLERFARVQAGTYFYESLIDFGDALLPDGHPSIEGHRLIANDLFEYLTENNIIPCD